jgi:chromosome segregation ATPase
MADESFEDEIAKVEARNRELTAHRDKLRAKLQGDRSRDARISRAHDRQRELEREIAQMEGRPYHDEDDPYAEPPEPPDPPDEKA